MQPVAIFLTIFSLLVAAFVTAFLDESRVGQREPTPDPGLASADAPAPLAGFARRDVTADLRAALAEGAIDFSAPAPFPLRVRVAKRALDLVASVCGLVLGAPLMLLIALGVKLSSPGPILYKQERVLRFGASTDQTFLMLKFRTMRSDAEAATGPVWAQRSDSRVTTLGRVLRKTRMDELPQLLNVLRGEMSLVGPRPERPFFTDRFRDQIPGYADRAVSLKPGLTGWAQVRGTYDSSMDTVRQKLVYDLAYGAHLYRLRSYLVIEAKILFLTVWVVITGKGAH